LPQATNPRCGRYITGTTIACSGSSSSFDTGRAEDLASEVFLDVWSQADRFEGRSQVTTWILSIARHKALSLLAQRRRRVVELDDIAMELIEDTADTPEQTVLNQDCGVQLRTCLDQMSREHREIIDLFYYHEKSVEEVADILHMPRNTVKTPHLLRPQAAGAALVHAPGFFDHLVALQAA
jgi:RNA polymerase sigma-70 factor (ECF subfamily)